MTIFSLFARAICFAFFHDLIVLKEFRKYGASRLLYCQRCKRYFGMHDETRSFVPWDASIEQMYRDQGEL